MPTNSLVFVLKRSLVAAILWSIAGCVTRPVFEEVVVDEQVDVPVARHALASLPFSDHWTKLILNGADAGFTHLSVSSGATPNDFVLLSEAYLQLFLLGTKTTIVITATDWVDANLRLKQFHYVYVIDGVKTLVEGTVDDGELSAHITDDSGARLQTTSLERAIYPSRAVPLYPVVNGLQVGKSYSYSTYDGETQSVKAVVQRIAAYGTSDQFEGYAYRVMSNVSGSAANIWIDERGRAVLEVSMKGIFLSKQLDSHKARATLVRAAFNQIPFYADYTTLGTKQSIDSPRTVKAMRVNLSGLDPSWVLPNDGAQRCWRESTVYACQIVAVPGRSSTVPIEEVEIEATLPSSSITSEDPAVQRIAANILNENNQAGLELIHWINDWIARRVRNSTAPVQTASQVLGSNSQSGSLGRTYLFAALARSLGIPTRIVNGLVYSQEHQGFIYHSWAESWVDEIWYRVDPAFGGLLVDATHIKLIVADTLDEVSDLSDVIGRLTVNVIAYDH